MREAARAQFSGTKGKWIDHILFRRALSHSEEPSRQVISGSYNLSLTNCFLPYYKLCFSEVTLSIEILFLTISKHTIGVTLFFYKNSCKILRMF